MSYRNNISVLKDISDDMKVFMGELAYNVASHLAFEMPVDSGRARSSVIISNEINDESREPFFDYGRRSDADRTETLNLNAVKRELKKESEQVKPFSIVYIMNNVENNGYQYAGLLNQGYSQQTEAGMTRRSIVTGLRQTEVLMKLKGFK